tara:strand:- start:260 stop:433 length:174 start_codon:yes stop_codon:yes gene_type:complete
MKKGAILEYTGKGFIGYNPDFTEMTFICHDFYDYSVEYSNGKDKFEMLVRPSEVKLK